MYLKDLYQRKLMSADDRAKSLIAIAHPDFRDQPTFEAKAHFL